ncbi:4-hydroxythreonine-4-phosphate dehydrogenase [Sphingomonas metalli]|uniref:4-hydroxythreonine-4-phosphate dehydrogenase n=1 Tax=Sphingomonas metalli TaxID=1779358 RepID=A0A916WVR9_9SPHN|nr:4-hydroxythreonine-4-phosphate dehydrogenase PdxA [Sphingomonas metalli]GGB33775.1 4-hydroxythreonine-4-phosphate dehydrogenase [Sphingomonas metalli]
MTGQPAPAPLGIALGDPAGIGPEVVAKAWEARGARALPCFFTMGDPAAVRQVWDGPVAEIAAPHEAAAHFASALPVLAVAEAGPVTPGVPTVDGARCALASLEAGIALARSGEAGALVTAPVSKAELYAIGFTHPGQTEFVAERCGVAAADAVMMLAGPGLRVVPLTIHEPLAKVPELLTVDLILSRARTTARGLQRDFGIAAPRLVLAGLNPHAGEGGAIGREEIEVLEPALAVLRAEGMDIAGPLPADTMFHARARAGYDAALCCYHDQALVPIKTLHFDDGVNITLGLPIVRTSPDHGTAFGIAGRNLAEPGAMIAAIVMAGQAAARRAATV